MRVNDNLTIGLTCYPSCLALISRGAILWSNYAARSNTLFPSLPYVVRPSLPSSLWLPN